MFHSTKQFLVDVRRKTFAAFASDLSMGGKQEIFGRAFPDSCDQGFTMMSHATGHEAKFFVFKEEKREGDLAAWHLKPTHETLHKIPSLTGWEAVVFNT